MTTMKMYVSNKVVFDMNDEPYSTLTLSADYADGANKEWAKYTPSATLTATVKGSVSNEFNLGDKVTVSLVINEVAKAPEKEVPDGDKAS